MKNTLTLLLLICFSALLRAQTDTVPPVVVCKTHYFRQLDPYAGEMCYIGINASDLIDTAYDDSSFPLALGIGRPCSTFEFPGENSPFTVVEGFSDLTVWAKDSSGNTASCSVNVLIGDSGYCDFEFDFKTETYENDNLPNTKVIMHGWNCLGDTIHVEATTNNSGQYMQYGKLIPDYGYTATLKASRTMNPLNGVTTYDLVEIQKHILGIKALGSPYKMIAADANFDGKITTIDIVLLRKLILGLIPELPNGQSWRFVAGNYNFPNPANPFDPPFPDSFIVKPNDEYLPSPLLFRGVKIGDVNGSAIPEN